MNNIITNDIDDYSLLQKETASYPVLLMAPVIYSIEVCPTNNNPQKHRISLTEKNMEDKESLFEMRYRACFAREAPVLMTDTRVYESKDLFGADGAVLESVIADLR